jgi:hypothetical protein
MDIKLLISLFNAFEKEALQTLVTYHGLKAKGAEKQAGMLAGFYETNLEALYRDLNRFDTSMFSKALRSIQAKEVAAKLIGKSDFAYNEEALQTFLEASSKEQLIGFIKSIFLKAKVPRELLEFKRELSTEDKKHNIIEMILGTLEVGTLNSLAEQRSLKAARTAEARKKILREAYGPNIALLLRDLSTINPVLLLTLITGPVMVKVAHQSRGDAHFNYRLDKLTPLVSECTEEEIEHLAKLIFVEDTIPEEYSPFEFPLDANGRNYQEEREIYEAQLAAMEVLPDDTTSNPEKALSIKQPWADLILTGVKKVELRAMETNVRERVYIYASNGIIDEQGQQRCQELNIDPEILPRGMIIGTVQIVGCLPSRRGDAEKSGGLLDTQTEGWYTWYLARPRRLKRDLFPKNNPQPGLFKPF